MFLREIKTKGKTYLNIIESYWKDGKPRHRSIASLGRLDNLQNTKQLRKIALGLLRYCKENHTPLDLTTCEETQRKIWGAPVVIKKIWDKFKLDELFTKLIGSRKIKFDVFSSIFLMVIDRLLSPQSKLQSYEKQGRYWNIKENELHHLYRALDLLQEEKEQIEDYLFNMHKSLFNMKVDVVFYDVTTLYFESVRRDTLRDFGFSKDLKVNEVQIVLGLLLDQEGRPIGYDLFPGNIYEGKTLKDAVEKLKERFQINKLILVGDRAMLSKDNLQLISSRGYEYIVGFRIRNTKEEIQNKILKEAGYMEVKTEDMDEVFKYKEIYQGQDRIICSYSSKRARKDQYDRERLIEKAEKILEGKKSVISKRGAARYLEIKSLASPQIDESKIKEDEKFDGYSTIITNCRSLQGKNVLEAYHGLWKIEEAFRVLKSHIEARPIFHWTEKRIKGHIMLCFLAFLIERTLELELKAHQIDYSPTRIKDALNSLQFSEIECEGQIFYLRSPVEGLANDILRTLKIRVPAKITTPEGFVM